MKPKINLDELEYVSDGPGLPGQHSPISEIIGAKKLGYNISICPPGKSVCPFHNHRINEEMIFVIEGTGLLRFGKAEWPLRANDVVAFPPGGPDVAHQIINSGATDLKYLALSTMFNEEVAEYPDSNKVGVFVGKPGQRDYRKIFKADHDLDYYDGESPNLLKK